MAAGAKAGRRHGEAEAVEARAKAKERYGKGEQRRWRALVAVGEPNVVGARRREV